MLNSFLKIIKIIECKNHTNKPKIKILTSQRHVPPVCYSLYTANGIENQYCNH